MSNSYRQSFFQIIKIDFERHFKNSTRMFWLLCFVFLVGVYTTYSIIAARDLRNFYGEDVFSILMVNFVLIVQIQTLPIILLIIIYDSLIQDPTMKLAAVASSNRTTLFLSRLASIAMLIYLIFLIQIVISYFVLSLYLGYSTLYTKLFVKSLLPFLLIILYYCIAIAFLVLAVYQLTQDKLSSNILPILVFYIIPYLISSSLVFEILSPVVKQLSPIIWVIEISNFMIFNQEFVGTMFIFPISLVLFSFLLKMTISRYQFN